MKCNMLLSSFVRKNLDNAHKVLVERILKKAERVEETIKSMGSTPITPGPGSLRFQAGSHMSSSQILNAPAVYNRPLSPQMLSPQQDMGWQQKAMHPAYRSDDNRMSTYSLPPYQPQPYAQQQRMSYYAPLKQPEPPRQFVAELPGSTYHTSRLSPPQQDAPSLDHLMTMMSELSASETGTYNTSLDLRGQSENGSIVSENFNVRRLSAQGYTHDRPQSVVSGTSGHSSNPDRMSMISELPSSQQR